jgi:hypothetical protein
MVICDKCPCFDEGETSEWCKIKDSYILWNFDVRHYASNDCPMKQIELKDGTIFRPEEA